MTLPPAVPYSGRDKRSEVAFNLALVVGGSLLVAVGAAQVPQDLTWMWVLISYTVFAVLCTALLACVQATKSQLPTLSAATFESEPALVLQSWRAPWWHANALDLGLGVVGAWLALLGAAAGAELAVVGALAGCVGLWFLVRVGLVLAGKRRRPALWLTRDEVVVDSPSGRARGPRSSIRRVRSRAARVVIELDSDADWALCPGPWRPRGRPLARATLVLDCSETGHRAADLADWLERSRTDSACAGLPAPGQS